MVDCAHVEAENIKPCSLGEVKISAGRSNRLKSAAWAGELPFEV